MHHIKSVYIT